MLKIDRDLKKINVKELSDPIKQIKLLLLGTLISVNLYSGITLEKTYSETKDSYSSEESIYDIPEYYKTQIEKQCNITIDNSYSNFDEIEKLKLRIDNDDSLEFLGSFHNLKNLSLSFNESNNYVLDTVPEIISLQKLTIKAMTDLEISEKVNNLIFEKNKDNIKYLCLDGVIVGPNVIENLSNLEELKLATSLNYDIDFTKLKIDTLDLSSYGEYDLPIFLSKKDYIDLIDNEVNFDFGENEFKYIDVLNRLDSIIESLDIEDKSDKEIIASVVCYVLDNLNYDDEILSALENGEDVSSMIRERGFYSDGRLKGALEYETQICGNYTSLCNALLNELNIDSFYLIGDSHAWSIIEVEGELYYVDTTLLDIDYDDASKRIKSGDTVDLDWYMEEVNSSTVMNSDDDHQPIIFPKYLESNNYSEKESEDYVIKEENNQPKVIKGVNKEVNVKVNNKNHKVPLAALIGVFAALGIAIPVKRKRRKVMQINNIYIDEIDKINFNNDYNYYDYEFKGRK